MISRRYLSLLIGRAPAPSVVLLAFWLAAQALAVNAAEPVVEQEPALRPKPVVHHDLLKDAAHQAATKSGAGDYVGAMAVWTRVIQHGPEHTSAYGYVQRAKIKRHMGDQKGAVQDLDLALAGEPTNFVALFERAALRRRLGDNHGALTDLDKAIEIQPHKAEAYVERGWLKMAMADYVGSYNDYHSAITINPNLKGKLAAMAHPQVSAHLDMDASGIHKDFDNTAARHNPADHTNYDTAADWAPHGPAPVLNQTQLARLNNSAVKEINSGQFEAAVKTLHELIEAAPDYANARENLTIAYNNWGLELAKRTPALAARQFRQALFLDPSQGASRRNLEAMIKEIGKNPHEAEDRLDLARESLNAGDREGAYVEATEAIKLKNNTMVRAMLRNVLNALDEEAASIKKASLAKLPVTIEQAKSLAASGQIVAAEAMLSKLIDETKSRAAVDESAGFGTLDQALETMAALNLKTGSLIQAQTHLGELVTLRESTKGAHDPLLLHTYKQYAAVLKDLGRINEAKVYEDKAQTVSANQTAPPAVLLSSPTGN